MRARWILSAAGLVAACVTPAAALEGSSYVAVPPCRIVDTRVAGGIVPANTGRVFDVVGASTDYSAQGGNPAGCGIPGFATGIPQVTAILVNLVAVDATGKGNLVVYSGDEVSAPPTATINFGALNPPTNLANAVAVPVRQDVEGDDLQLLARHADVHVVMDVLGYFTDLAVQPLPGAGARAGEATVPAGAATVGTVTFSSPMADANYQVSIITVNAQTVGGTGSGTGCSWNVDSRATTGFTYACRAGNNGAPTDFTDGLVIGWIATPNQ